MITLDVPQILEIHALHLKRLPITPGFRNPGLLLQIADHISYEDSDSSDMSGLYRQAAFYWHGLARSFVFRDGNAAIAMHVMLTFLLLNGCNLNFTEDELIDAAQRAASWKMELEDCVDWIRSRSQQDNG